MNRFLRAALVAIVGLTLPAQAVAGGDQHDLLKKADAIAAKVAKLRGLDQKRTIKRGVMQKHEIRKRLIERVDGEYSAAELAAEELAMKRLGLLPADADYKKLVIDLLTDQIAGFYDPVEQQLYIAGWQQTGMEMFEDILMAHEIDHALQDQHFGLRKFMRPDKGNSDATVARQALVEGDGTALMFEYMMSSMGMEMPWADQKTTAMMSEQMTTAMAGSAMATIPLVLREGLIFPYMKGLAFVAHFRKHHPWKRIDAIYKKPPLSTEHILHPEKYLAYERPDEIKAGAIAALAGFERVYDNVNGEFGLAIFLRQHAGARMKRRGDVYAPREKAERAAAGWGGDRLAIYAPPGHEGKLAGTVGVSYSVWDETADAIEFFEMLSDAMPSLSGGKAIKDGEEYIEYRDDSGATFLAQRKNDAVVLVMGADQSKAPVILEQVWKSWRVKRY
jgi:hypothetical protein